MSRVAYGFAGKSYDLAVIGGGPGGNSVLKQAMLLPSKPHNLV